MISKWPVVSSTRLIPWVNQCKLHKVMVGHEFVLALHSNLAEYLEEVQNLHDAMGTQCAKAADFYYYSVTRQ